MKIDELMIGDWVNIHGDNWRATLATLQLACNKPGTIKPITLTSEILEKNGFEKHISDTRMFFQHGEYHLSYYIVNKHFTIYNQVDGSLIQRVIVNVHELQHALKICGIDKEIKL